MEPDVARLLELLRRDLADVAEEVRGGGPVLVLAGEYPLRRSPPGSSTGSRAGNRPCRPRAPSSGSPARPARRGCRPASVLRISSIDMPVTVESWCSSRERVGPGAGRSCGFTSTASSVRFATMHLAVAVEDVAARRLHADLADAVVVRLRPVLVAGEDLHVPEAEEEHGEDRDRESRSGSRSAAPAGMSAARARIRVCADTSWLTASPRRRGAGRAPRRPSLVDEGGAHHQSDAKEDGNRESRPDQAGDDRVTHDQEADVRVHARADLDRRDHQRAEQGQRSRRAGRPPRGLGGRPSRGSARRRSRRRAA